MSKRQVNNEHRDRIDAWRKDAEGLTYEEAMQALDLLLAEQPMQISRGSFGQYHRVIRTVLHHWLG